MNTYKFELNNFKYKWYLNNNSHRDHDRPTWINSDGTKGWCQYADVIETMINLLILILMVINHGANMVDFIVMVTFLLGFGQMEQWNIGLMMRKLNEYI
jgi:hypothetical protein